MKVKQQWFRKMDIDGSSMKIQDIALAADGAGSLYFVGQEQDGKIFLTKMSRSGNELWRKQVSTPQDSGAWLFSLATDGHGNIYLTGTITVAAEAGQPSRRSAWLAKFSSDGTELWQRALAGQNDWGIHLAADGAGSIYLVGGAGAAVGNNFDTWLAKISAAGDELWRRELGRQQVEYYALGAVAADWAGNVCFLGVTERIATAGQKNARAVKFSPDGAELWRQDIGTVMDDAGTGVGMDGAGNIYLAGFTNGEMAAGGGPQGLGSDGWLMKLAPDGTELWRKQMGTDKHDTIDALALDGLGNIYLVGSTEGEMVAGGAQGGRDAWVARFSPGGAEQWRYQLGTAGEDMSAHMAVLWSEGNSRGLAVDGGGNVYIFGYAVGDWRVIKHAWLAKLYNVPESFEEIDELNRLRFQTLQQQISGA